eukprot:TRINITY_DN12296_c0_g9_i1.p1 TRINITY_DN12296_c0_g9~~TRINITY_DN12296_c0_g9_i1.p1  ORF type:complete len:654 (+),score=138.10 TRINITY_DN12296_c0_g9_i1:116-2077(+)
MLILLSLPTSSSLLSRLHNKISKLVWHFPVQITMANLPACKYGAACYRSDPRHLTSFTHPCRYGAACYRKDQAHFRQFTHPDAHTPRPPPQIMVDRHNDDDDESDDAPTHVYNAPKSPRAPRSPHMRATSPIQAAKAVTVEEDDDDDDDMQPALADNVAGLTVVFTGTCAGGTRKEMERKAGLLGVRCLGNVSKHVDYLVMGDIEQAHGNKEDKAEALGVPIITESAWDSMVTKTKSRKKTSAKRKHAQAHADNPGHVLGHGAVNKRNTSDNDDKDDDDDDDDGDDDGAPAAKIQAAAKAIQPLHQLADGESVDFTSSSNNIYKLKHVGNHYYCTCPAWRNQSAPVDARSCKHLAEYLGADFEKERVGHVVAMPLRAKGAPKPQLLLAHKWEDKRDPTGWHMSEKLDGVRAFWDGKQLLSRLGNPFAAPDWFTQQLPTDHTLDGELFVGRGKFSATVSIVKTSGTDRWKQVKYMVFDSPSRGDDAFEARIQSLQQWHSQASIAHVEILEHTICKGAHHVETELKRVVDVLGGEGLMLRQPKSKYQAGRNYTLLKVKQFHDAEAIVRGYSAGKGKHKGKVGALAVEMACGKTFKVGSGLSDRERDHPPKIGAIVTYRFQELTDDGIPRFPTYVGERVDMTEPQDAVLTAPANAS